jgi:hypothetical protein
MARRKRWPETQKTEVNKVRKEDGRRRSSLPG